MDALPFRRTAVVGAGAVGCFFGAMLARAGHAVTLIGRPTHVDAVRTHGLQLRLSGAAAETLAVQASTELAAVAGADLVLVCVKSPDTESVARELAPLLEADALLLSLQNGVDNADTIARHVVQPVAPAVVYVAAAMAGPGVVAHSGRGDLVVGLRPGAGIAAARLQAVADLFASAQVPVQLSPDVTGELWLKLLANCAWNAVSAVTRRTYGEIAAQAPTLDLRRAVVHEGIAVAAAEGRTIDVEAAMAGVERIATAMPRTYSSTAQDLARGKPSEIDHLNGYLVRLGARHGVPTPVNQALWALVKLAESGRSHPGVLPAPAAEQPQREQADAGLGDEDAPEHA